MQLKSIIEIRDANILFSKFIIYIVFILSSSILSLFNYFYNIELIIILSSNRYISSFLFVIRAIKLLILLFISLLVISKDTYNRIDLRFLYSRRYLINLLLFLYCFLQKQYTRFIFYSLLLINNKIRVFLRLIIY